MPDSPKIIPVARPWLDEREAEAAKRPIMSGWVTQGPEVAAFENEFADYVGAKHACAVSSCTTALHLALLAVGVKPGDEVITVSHSFIATANSVVYCGAKPVFVDIQPETFNIDPGRIEKVITAKTRAILCVHQMGMPCDLTAITDLAQKKGLPVVEDAACAIGSEILWNGNWEKIGKPQGDIACFSFHPRKVITTGDGGMITTDNAEWDKLFRLLRVHGMSMDSSARHTAGSVAFESYLDLGYNYRMTDIQAAIGREQLKRLPEIVAQRRKLGDRYRKLLADIPGVTPPQSLHGPGATGRATVYDYLKDATRSRSCRIARGRGLNAALSCALIGNRPTQTSSRGRAATDPAIAAARRRLQKSAGKRQPRITASCCRSIIK